MLLNKSKPMTNYEDLKPFYEFLKLKNNPKKHWIDTTWWELLNISKIKSWQLVRLLFMGPSLLH